MLAAARDATTELRSGRIRLRRFRPEDVDDVYAYASDPEVTRAAGWEPHRTPMDTIAYVQQCMAADWGPITLGVELASERRIVGVVDLRIVSRFWSVGEIGYSLARPYWGRGLCLEATRLLCDFGFRSLNLRRIRAACRPDNRRSYATMLRLGMRPEASAQGRAGVSEASLVCSVRRADWERRGSSSECHLGLVGMQR